MNLNLQNKIVIISSDSTGIYHHIESLLTKEGAVTILNNSSITLNHLNSEDLKVCAMINIQEDTIPGSV